MRIVAVTAHDISIYHVIQTVVSMLRKAKATNFGQISQCQIWNGGIAFVVKKLNAQLQKF
jgi:hypothetical protein